MHLTIEQVSTVGVLIVADGVGVTQMSVHPFSGVVTLSGTHTVLINPDGNVVYTELHR